MHKFLRGLVNGTGMLLLFREVVFVCSFKTQWLEIYKSDSFALTFTLIYFE